MATERVRTPVVRPTAAKSVPIYLRSSIGGYFFDVVFRENYLFTNEITQHPVQSGAAISDHVYHQPMSITFDVGVSDCLGSVVKGQFDKLGSRSATAFAIFQKLWLSGVPLKVNTSINGVLLSFSDTVIKTINVTRDKTTHTVLRMTITLQQVIKATATTVGIQSQNQVANSVPDNFIGPMLPEDHQVVGQTNGGTVNAGRGGGGRDHRGG